MSVFVVQMSTDFTVFLMK